MSAFVNGVSRGICLDGAIQDLEGFTIRGKKDLYRDIHDEPFVDEKNENPIFDALPSAVQKR